MLVLAAQNMAKRVVLEPKETSQETPEDAELESKKETQENTP
jgi:hypothetical protein